MSKKFSIICGVILLGTLSQADQITERRNFRTVVSQKPATVKNYLADRDPEIRRYALYLYFQQNPQTALKHLKSAALNDRDAQVRLTAVMALSKIAQQSPEVQKLLEKIAQKDPVVQIRQIAVRASWPFYRKIELLSEDPSWDYDVVKVKSLPLPLSNWDFVTDPKASGHWKNYFLPGVTWPQCRKIKIGYWENQGLEQYDGIAWYRITFTMPPKIDSNAVEISFGAVDESAWVWLNGIYLGCHDMGTAGWNVPFRVDCRKEIHWGAKNTLVIRVQDTNAGGGIWKPVNIDILK